MTLAIAAALLAPIGTATLLGLTPQVLSVSANSLRPQFTSAWVSITTMLSAGVSSAHLEFAPQPPLHDWLFASSFIEPDASNTMRMSGGSLVQWLVHRRAVHAGDGALAVLGGAAPHQARA